MRYWIDGYNLIGQVSFIKLSDSQKEEKLLQWLDRFIKKKYKAVVVFDGQQHQVYQTQYTLGVITCVYTDPYESADDFLIKKMEQHKHDVWVSSDRKIKDHAISQKRKYYTCLEWLSNRLSSDQSVATDEKSVYIGNTEDWLKIFSS